MGVHGGWESLEGGLGDQTQWTASVTLNSQVERSHGNVLHQWNGPVGVHLGHRNRRCVVAVHAGLTVERNSVVLASLGTYLGGTNEEGQLAFKGGVMWMSATRASVGVRDDLQVVRGTQIGHSAPVVECEVVGFESFGGTGGARAARWLRRGVGSGTRGLGYVTRRSIPNWFDSHVQGGEVEVKERRVASRILLQFDYILSKE